MGLPRFADVGLLRAAVFTAVIMFLSTTAHLAGGGALPSTSTGLLLAAVLFPLCAVATRWRPGTLTALAVLSIGQLGLHEALMHTSGHIPMAGMSTTMATFHGVAGVLTALLLVHGEATVWRLWRWLAPTVKVPQHHCRRQTRRAPLSRDSVAVVRPVLSVAPLRGPPQGRFAA